MSITKTFIFTSGSENLTEQGTSPVISFSYNGSDGSPDAGCVCFQVPGGTSSFTGYEIALQTPLSQTWEDWGVSAAYAVTGVTLVGFKRKATENLVTLPPRTSGTPSLVEALKIDITNSSGTSICNLFDGPARPGSFNTWVNTSGDGPYSITGSYQPYNTEIRLQLRYDVALENGVWNTQPEGGDPTILIDSIELRLELVPTGEPEPDPEPAPEPDPEPDPEPNPGGGGGVPGGPLDDYFVIPVDGDRWLTITITPPPAEVKTLGTYNLDLFFNHRYRGSRESIKFTRTSKSMLADIKQMQSTVDTTTALLPTGIPSKTAEMQTAIKNLQKLQVQFMWRLQNAV